MGGCSKTIKTSLVFCRDQVCIIPVICGCLCYGLYVRCCTNETMIGPITIRSYSSPTKPKPYYGRDISAPFDVIARSSTQNIEVPIAEIETIKSEVIDRC